MTARLSSCVMREQHEHCVLLAAGPVLAHLAGGGVAIVRFPTVRTPPASDVSQQPVPET